MPYASQSIPSPEDEVGEFFLGTQGQGLIESSLPTSIPDTF